MQRLKTFFAGILAALLGAIFYFSQREELKPESDPYEAEQAELEKELAEVNVEAEELSAEEVVDYWRKK